LLKLKIQDAFRKKLVPETNMVEEEIQALKSNYQKHDFFLSAR